MTCPLCHRTTTWEGNRYRPFCSEKCQLTDLGLWAGEQYRIPGRSLGVESLKTIAEEASPEEEEE